MKLIPLNCRQCGAPLSVPEDVRHVTCLHCGTQLAVVREGAAAYTEILEQLERRTTNVEVRLDALQRQHLVNQLDQDWYEDREQYYVRTKEGRTYLPSKIEAVFYAGGALVVAVIVAAIFITMDDPTGRARGFGILASLFLGVVGLGGSALLYRKRAAYDEAEKHYLLRRAELTGEG
ncbi:hypothetical protein DTL42_09395 [Bremerella cremea]|uniref:Zinc ribbon domain-containing protein n=1 Tax=Bremerella cremea TaxID=1031537 RepID=A0A368KTL5_9BACT|nr:zinc ribbon domain-containing protein [Bremerella cremea]RCS53017.1 hypothetical protein DTL42_09395 [Bremerella cremea]